MKTALLLMALFVAFAFVGYLISKPSKPAVKLRGGFGPETDITPKEVEKEHGADSDR